MPKLLGILKINAGLCPENDQATYIGIEQYAKFTKHQ